MATTFESTKLEAKNPIAGDRGERDLLPNPLTDRASLEIKGQTEQYFGISMENKRKHGKTFKSFENCQFEGGEGGEGGVMQFRFMVLELDLVDGVIGKK